MLKAYPKTTKLVFKNFPLRSHKFAGKAAAAALAAHEKGKFWEYHDLLFAHYRQLSDEKLNEISRELGLDHKEIRARMQDATIKKQIARDLADGMAAGVTGTPTLFINGRRLNDRSMEAFRQAIENELARQKKSSQ